MLCVVFINPCLKPFGVFCCHFKPVKYNMLSLKSSHETNYRRCFNAIFHLPFSPFTFKFSLSFLSLLASSTRALLVNTQGPKPEELETQVNRSAFSQPVFAGHLFSFVLYNRNGFHKTCVATAITQHSQNLCRCKSNL